MVAASDVYHERMKAVDSLRTRIDATRNELAALEKLYQDKVRELEPLRLDAEKLAKIRELMISVACQG